MRFSKVIMVTVDCLRASALHCLGSRNNTNNIDRLAKNGILFKQAIANGPGTPQSFPAIFTSTYPLMHRKIIPSPRYQTLAEILVKKGFMCAGFHSNPFLSKLFNWDRGFKTFYDFSENIETTSSLILKYPPQIRSKISKIINKAEENKLLEKLVIYASNFYIRAKSQQPYLSGEKINKFVFDWLRKHNPKKFFLWVHYMDPHSPYSPTQYKTKKSSIQRKKTTPESRYNLEVEYVDDCIGELIKTLEELRLISNSIIILTADHGEGFGEHDIHQHFQHVLYEELIHIPLIINGLEQRKIVSTPVGLIDLLPTILDALNVEKPRALFGKSLLPLIENKIETQDGVFSESAHYNLEDYTYNFDKSVYSYREKEWKLIINHIKGTKELYNLHKDPDEQENKISLEKDLTNIFAKKIEDHIHREKRVRVLNRVKCSPPSKK